MQEFTAIMHTETANKFTSVNKIQPINQCTAIECNMRLANPTCAHTHTHANANKIYDGERKFNFSS